MKAEKIIIPLLILLLISIKSEAQKYSYSSPTGRCKITFPANYTETVNSEGGVPFTSVKADYNGETYMLKFSFHKSDAVSADNKYFLNSAANTFIDATGAIPVENSDIKQGKYFGKSILAELKNKSYFIHYQTFIANRIHYQFFVISKSKEKTEEINNFFQSFQITTQ